MVVLWLLILRGVAIEFRSHQDHPLWRELWDTVFSAASALLAVPFGITLGNLVRGVPLRREGLPGLPLFTDFKPGREPGIVDWYTGLVGLFTLAALAGHGALYLAWRVDGPVRERSLGFARRAWTAALALWVVATAATTWVRPDLFAGLASRPWTLGFVALASVGAWGAFQLAGQGRELAAFLSSSAFLFGLVATALAGNYPFWLRSTLDLSDSLTATNSASDRRGLGMGFIWWAVGIALVAVYFTHLFRSVRDKVRPGYGHGPAGSPPSPLNP
jgi:cytochrome d ubiquinol oxidase subunit II